MGDALNLALQRHQLRRDQGVPTVTWLRGAPDAWPQWLGRTDRHGLEAPWTNADAALERWWASTHASLRRQLVRRAATALGRPTVELRLALVVRTASERERLLDRLSDALPTMRALLPLLAERSLPTALDEPTTTDALQAAAELLHRLPALLVHASDLSALAFATRLAEVCPALPLAVVTKQLIDTTPLPAHARDLLREGAIDAAWAPRGPSATALVPPLPTNEAPHPRSEPPPTTTDRSATAAWLTSHNAAPELLALFSHAASTLDTPSDPPEAAESRARSAAELFLYRCFELVPELQGKFELNGTIDRDFGGRPMEIDLLARRERIALEVDGYFHFQDASRYRRDRRKDWWLQRDRFLVIRWMAEDVVADVEAIIARVVESMRWRSGAAKDNGT